VLLLALPWAAGSCELICEVPPPIAGDAGDDDADDVTADGADDAANDDAPDVTGDTAEDGGETCDTGTEGPPAPALLWPPNGARTGSHRAPAERQTLRPVLRWRPSSCAGVEYEVQVDDSCPAVGFTDCAFPSPEASATGVTETDWQPTEQLAVATAPPAGRRYFWRVRAALPAGTPGPWSAPRYLDVGRAAGDLDGDGHADLVVGAPGDGSGAGTGRVFVHLGAATPDDAADVVLEQSGGVAFGAAATGAGDLNADGFADLVVGDPQFASTGRDHGAVFVYLGGNPIATTSALTLEGTANGEQLGTAMAGAGDLDADGTADLLVGVPDASATGGGAGRVLVLLGGTTPDVVPDLTLDGTSGGMAFGAAVAGAGDINADGFADFLVGAPGADDGGSDAGAVFLYRGGRTLDVAPWLVWGGSVAGERVGEALAGLGDVDGDGFEDCAIGIPGGDGAQPDSGRVDLCRGGVAPVPIAAAVFAGTGTGERFGAAVAAVGDVNGDGRADLLVGAPAADGGATDAGRADLFFGAVEPDPTPGLRLPGTAGGDAHGTAVAGPGDLDADGFADYAVASPFADAPLTDAGRVAVGLGGAAPEPEPALEPAGTVANGEFGSAIASDR
jgi:hypothetical protein